MDSDSLYTELCICLYMETEQIGKGILREAQITKYFSKYQQGIFNCETKYMILKDFECFANRIRTFLWATENFLNQKCNMTLANPRMVLLVAI